MFLRRLRHPVVIAALVLGTAHGTLFYVHKRITEVGNYQRAHNIFNGERSDTQPAFAPQFAADACSVTAQPAGSGEQADKERIVFDYYTAATDVINDGQTIRVQMKHGSTLTVAGIPYQLEQIHFHRVAGSNGDLLAHLIHRADDGHRLELAVLLHKGRSNPALEKLWHYLPPKAGERNSLWDVRIDPNELLPRDHTFYRYTASGSCGKTQWLALVTPTELSPAQLAAYDHLYQGDRHGQAGRQAMVAAAD